MKRLLFPARRTTASTVVFCLTLAVAVLVSAIGLGVRLPSDWLGRVPADSTDIGYDALGRHLPRLRDGYVQQVLEDGRETVSTSDSATSKARPSRSYRGLGLRAPVAHAFTNDDVERAYAVEALPFAARSDTSRATRQAGEPSGCLAAGGTAWYRYTARVNGGLFADTFGTGRPAALAVYQGDKFEAMKQIGCDANVVGNAQIGFLATAATTYFFQVSAPVDGIKTVFELASVGRTTFETLSPIEDRPDGTTGSPASSHPDISADGRWVVFVSNARNLTARPVDCGGSPKCNSLYLRDRATKTTTLIATAAAAEDVPMFYWPSLTPDGRYVGFAHWEVPGAPGFHGPADAAAADVNVYLYDRVTRAFEMVSRNSQGEPARGALGRDAMTMGFDAGPLGGSIAPSISASGRYVVFTSDGANLGGHVERGKAWNVYRRDRITGTTQLVSVDSAGEPMRANSFACTGRNMSGDGRYVFFSSTAGTGQDDVHILHLYLWDAATGRTRQVTKVASGARTLGSYCPSISLDGSRTAFVSRDALVASDTNGTPDVYAYEVATGKLQRVSVTSAGEQTTDGNYYGTESSNLLPRSVSLSADGRLVAFDSSAPDLAPSPVGGARSANSQPGPIQVYVHDVVTGATVLASVSSTGERLAGNSVLPYLSPDGGAVAFMNSGQWSSRNTVAALDVVVHELL